MFWRDTELSYWWYRAPIETQAMMIEAFDEVANDAAAVEDCKVWLLKQKQTQNWKTTKANRRRGLCPADPRQRFVEVRRAGASDVGNMPIQPREGRGWHRLLRAALRPQARSSRRWATSR